MIAILLNSLRSGGAERAMVNLANALHARGMPVTLVLISSEGPLRQGIAPKIEMVELRARRAVAALPALVTWLRTTRPQVILSACANSNVVAVLAVRLAGGAIRSVVCEQTTLSRVARDTHRLRHILVPYAARWAYPRADAVVAVSEGVAQDLGTALGLSRGRVSVIPNPLTPSIAVDADRDLPHPWLRDAGAPVLLSVARLTPAKDLETLLRGFARLRGTREVRLVMLGDGEERARLQRLVNQLGLSADVDIAGFAANPYPTMAAAGALVLSSQREGLPTVLMEALTLGTPVVATDCLNGPREILDGGRWGRLVPTGDPEALAQAMDAALDDVRPPPPREILRRYSVDVVAQRYLELLDPGVHA